jgi:hypothetical protein
MIVEVLGYPNNKAEEEERVTCVCLSSCYESFVDAGAWAFATKVWGLTNKYQHAHRSVT